MPAIKCSSASRRSVVLSGNAGGGGPPPPPKKKKKFEQKKPRQNTPRGGAPEKNPPKSRGWLGGGQRRNTTRAGGSQCFGSLKITPHSGNQSSEIIYATKPLEQNEVRYCRVTTFGKADWARQQKTRLDVTRLRVTQKTLEEYQLSCNSFNAPNSSSKQVDSAQQSYAHAIAVSNISQGLAWWNGLFEQTQKLDEFQAVFRKRKELFKMVESTQFEDQSHIFFIKACHEAFKKDLCQAI